MSKALSIVGWVAGVFGGGAALFFSVLFTIFIAMGLSTGSMVTIAGGVIGMVALVGLVWSLVADMEG